MAWRTSMANSSRPGTTGKYVKRPRFRLPASGSRRSISPDIAQRFLSQHLNDGDFQGLGLVGPLRGQALQLDGETGYVDAVANRVSLVGGVRHLQEIGHVSQNSLLGERKILFENVVLFVAFGEIDENLRLQPGMDI